MKKIIGVLALSCLLLGFHSSAQALPSQDTHYQVDVTITPLGPNYYRFEYDVTNLDLDFTYHSGLDDFFVQIPLTATVSNITDPPPGFSPGPGEEAGYWIHNLPNPPPGVPAENGYQWLQWFGVHYTAVYPVGSTAHFSFEASGVAVGINTAVTSTYEGVYNPVVFFLEGDIQGPTIVPLPGPVWLLGSGLIGLAGLRKFRNG